MTPLNTAGFAHPARNVELLGIEPGHTVADFGSGSGAYVLAIAEKLQGSGHVYAVDVQQDLLLRIKNEAHKKHFKNVEIIWGDLEKIGGSKIADKHVDLVLISNLLFQVDEKEALLAEARRILRPSGKLVIIDWSESFGGLGPIKRAVVSRERALDLAHNAGFQQQEEFDAGAHHYGLILRPDSI
ncbi:MAG: type 11 methyltransferase [Candidatus Kaiserbacteria bacterium]|nr:type 11 methyltransferase [Candidatus Kaiserbacteria bacterium]